MIPILQVGMPEGVIERILALLDVVSEPVAVPMLLAELSLLWSALIAGVGVLLVLKGERWHRPLIATIAFLAGVGIGSLLLHRGDGKPDTTVLVVTAGAMGLIASILSGPLLRIAAAAFSGCIGAFLGTNALILIGPQLPDTLAAVPWLGAVTGFVTLAVLSTIMFRSTVRFSSGVGGSFMLLFGSVAMLLHIPSWHDVLLGTLTSTPATIPVLLVLGTVTSLVLQDHSPAGTPPSARPS